MPTLHKFAVLVIGAALLYGLLLGPAPERTTVRPAAGPSASATAAAPTPTATKKKKGPPPPPQPASAAAAQAKANELGEVPVIMYHRILAKTFSPLDRTPKQLRAELEKLAAGGYVPVTAAEFVQGRIDVPAGAHPVVLTFDDGNPSHFKLDAQGVPVKDTVVSILDETAARHPGFRPVATFYVNKDPFQLGAGAADGLRWLMQHGYEIANHTVSHPDLSRMSEKAVRSEISREEGSLKELTGVNSVTFAYPFGAVPRKRSWVSSGPTWKFQGIFLAGWRPAPSPFSKDFDALAIPRVRSQGKVKTDGCDQFCSTAWLEWLDNNPDKRYTSDGDPAAVTAPSAQIDALDPEFADRARVY